MEYLAISVFTTYATVLVERAVDLQSYNFILAAKISPLEYVLKKS